MISTQDVETNKYLHKSKIKTTKIIKIQNIKMRKEKRREEESDAQPKNALEPSCKTGMESLQILTSTHSFSLPKI